MAASLLKRSTAFHWLLESAPLSSMDSLLIEYELCAQLSSKLDPHHEVLEMIGFTACLTFHFQTSEIEFPSTLVFDMIFKPN